MRIIDLDHKPSWYDERTVTLPDLIGKRIESVRVTNVLSAGNETTGEVIITFTDQSVFTIGEEGQAGYMSMEYTMPDSPPPVQPRNEAAEGLLNEALFNEIFNTEGGPK